MARAFLELCHAQTCGKCVPCRIGLGQLNQLIRDVLNEKRQWTRWSLWKKRRCRSWTPPIAPSAMRRRTWSTRDSSATAMTMWSTSGTGAVPVPTTSRFPVSRSVLPMWTSGLCGACGRGRYADAIRLIRKDNPFQPPALYL